MIVSQRIFLDYSVPADSMQLQLGAYHPYRKILEHLSAENVWVAPVRDVVRHLAEQKQTVARLADSL